MATTGASVRRVRRQTNVRTQGNVAIPVTFISPVPAGRPILGGPALPVRVITAGELRANGGTFTVEGDLMAMPVMDAEANAIVDGGSAVPVYIVP